MRKLHVGHEEVHVLELGPDAVSPAEVVLPPLLLHLDVARLVRALLFQLLYQLDVQLLTEFLILRGDQIINFRFRISIKC